MGNWWMPVHPDDRRRSVKGRTHGLRSTYTHGCHCDDCREAERIYRSEYRRRVKKREAVAA